MRINIDDKYNSIDDLSKQDFITIGQVEFTLVTAGKVFSKELTCL